MSDPSRHAPTRVSPVPPKFPALFPTEVGFVPPPPAARAGGPDLPYVPGYAVTGEIARGGMGRVLAAHDDALDREVAVKVLLRGAPAGDLARRFRQEARITARLPHPGVPPVYALGELPDGSPFLAMKLIRGRTLAELLHERQRPTDDLPRLVQVFEQVCQAVGFAHAQGIVHRDLKPANVMVGSFGEVQVMDWGLAKEPGDSSGARRQGTGDGSAAACGVAGRCDDRRLTLDGQILGTPAYMAPEQARGEEPAFAADVFALGGILCEVLVERPPFVDEPDRSIVEVATVGDLADAFAALGASGADAELVSLATWCLSPNPAHRPADAKAVADVGGARGGGGDHRRAYRGRGVAAGPAGGRATAGA